MSTRIAYNIGSNIGRQVQALVNDIEEAKSRGRRLKAQLDSMVSGLTYSQVELEIGGMTPGDGQTLWGIISNAMVQLESNPIDELARLDHQ